MDGNVITAKRTASVSAIATKVSAVPGWAGRCFKLACLREKWGTYLGLLTNIAGTLHARYGVSGEHSNSQLY